MDTSYTIIRMLSSCFCVRSNVLDFSQEKNQSLNSSIFTLSSQLGQLHVHEEELSSMLKLKVALLPLGLWYMGRCVFLQSLPIHMHIIQDKDLTEATNHILSLTDRLKESESSLKECQSREGRMLQETEEYKRHFREARHQNGELKGKIIITQAFFWYLKPAHTKPKDNH